MAGHCDVHKIPLPYPVIEGACGKEVGRGGAVTSTPGFCFFHFVRRFWNQIFTCVSVRLNESAKFSLSQTDRYLVLLNLFSKATSCSYVKAVLALLGFPSFERSEAVRFLFDFEAVVDLVSSFSWRMNDSSANFSFSVNFSVSFDLCARLSRDVAINECQGGSFLASSLSKLSVSESLSLVRLLGALNLCGSKISLTLKEVTACRASCIDSSSAAERP